jgi:hypothetical protein
LSADQLRYELGDYAGLAECFDGLAGNAAAEGRAADAERLLVAAEEARNVPSHRSSLDVAVAGLLDLDLGSSVDQGAR